MLILHRFPSATAATMAQKQSRMLLMIYMGYISVLTYFIFYSLHSYTRQVKLDWPDRAPASRYRNSLIQHFETEHFQDPNAFYKLSDFPVNETLLRPKYTWRSSNPDVEPLTIFNDVDWINGSEKYCPNMPCKLVSNEYDAAVLLGDCRPISAIDRSRDRLYFSICYEPYRPHRSNYDARPGNMFYASFLESSTITILLTNREAEIRRFMKFMLEPMNVTLKNTFRKAPYNASLVSYISSNCVPLRNDYVAELANYVSVDSYGQCLQNRNETLQHEAYLPDFANSSNFDDAFRSEFRYKFGYKFCIAMSSSPEKDYITEKFFHAIYAGCVPIVNAKEEKYRRVLPGPKSAIFTEDFASPKDLGNYLKKLDENDNLYSEYFKWRENGLSGNFLNAWQRTEKTAICRICDFAYDYLFKSEIES